jgi:hypothetical protein
MMKSGGGKQKGSAFERSVCSELSLWLSGGQRKDLLWRSAMSGGRSTIARKKGDILGAQIGDISAVDPEGNRLLRLVMIECKAYKDFEFTSGVLDRKGTLWGFWAKLREEALSYRRHPMLIGRQNNRPAFCLIAEDCFNHFGLHADHFIALLPQWYCGMILFDVFLREATIPDGLAATGIDNRRRRVV